LLAQLLAGALANAPGVRPPVSDTQFNRSVFRICSKQNHHFFRHNACPVTGQASIFAGPDSISRAGGCTGRRRGLNKAMGMPVAGIKNRFVLA
jgi:hypothetical protein